MTAEAIIKETKEARKWGRGSRLISLQNIIFHEQRLENLPQIHAPQKIVISEFLGIFIVFHVKINTKSTLRSK